MQQHVYPITVLVLPILLIGCQSSEGRWDHYASGGRFIGSRPAMSPDGSSIVYSSARTGHGDICRFDIKRAETVRLTNSETYEGDPAFSSDGKSIVFVREENAIGNIWIMDGNGSNQRRLTMDKRYDHTPSFSPNGERILFTRPMRPEGRLGGAPWEELFIMNRDGSRVDRLTENEFADWEGSFSPSGDSIIYSKASQGIMIMDLTRKESRLILPGASPALSPDGKMIVCITGKYGREISVAKADGTDAKVILKSDDYSSHPSFTPDGMNVLFLKEKGARGMGTICSIGIKTMIVTPITETE